ncbi:MAG: Asp-tRNA(Asn)/Glu-tRNA(Gln) amidotransferase GatCAB subunit A [Gammaproteobacteria bacterium]|nr:Asp-tRNA(Asn)/Glu-tRNA(Gln) amidotransferase GatCAB subunit A [Gammaproteobacteria bacterium]
MLDQTLTEQLTSLKNGDYSSYELTDAYIKNIEKHRDLNCYISLNEKALEEAKRADLLRSKKEMKPLLGIPIAHKDIFCENEVKTTAGSKMLENFLSPYDATVVSKLREAGAVSIGKTNMDEFAMGSSNETSFFGPVKNPWDESRVPGGSSGGSAAAVSARLCSAATGTDTGGSIRQPASFCGITGLKPTYGRVSRWGMIAYASSLDQAGPMAISAEDCAIILREMSGYDEKDSTSSKLQVADYTSLISKPIDRVKIGIFRPLMEDLDTRVGKLLEETIRELEKNGVSFVEIELPNFGFAIPAYYVIAPAECSANLSRYDGVRFGYRCDNPIDLKDLYQRSRTEGLGREVKNRIMAGTFALTAGYYDAYYNKAQQVRRLIKNDFVEAFKKVDAIIAPTTPSAAFRLGEKSNRQKEMYLQDIYTTSANLAGLPALSMPAGFLNNLPIGAQLIGNYFDERLILSIAHLYQTQTDWHLTRPGKKE